MKISINSKIYEDISWNGSGFSMETEMTLANAEKTFAPGKDTNLILYDGEQEIARYYNKGIDSMTVSGTNPRVITVMFNLTQITEEAEAEIRTSIEDSDGAIEELAAIVGELADLGLTELAGKLREIQETVQTWFGNAEDIMSYINLLRREGGIIEQHNARITALEKIVGIVSVVKNN